MTQMIEFVKKDYDMGKRREFRKLVTQTIDRGTWFYDSEEYGVRKTLATVIAIVTTSLVWEIGRHMLLITKKVRPFGKETERFRRIGWEFSAMCLMDAFGVPAMLWMATEILRWIHENLKYQPPDGLSLSEWNRFKICLLEHYEQIQYFNRYPAAEEVSYIDVAREIQYSFLATLNPAFLMLGCDDLQRVACVKTPSVRRELRSAKTVGAIQFLLQKEAELIEKREAKRKVTAKLCPKHNNAQTKAVLKKRGFIRFVKCVSVHVCTQCDRLYDRKMQKMMNEPID